MDLDEAADEISRRIIGIFRRDGAGNRPVLGTSALFQTDPHWRDLLPFHEYFHGDSGAGVGASHQTGWSALVACMILELAKNQTAEQPEELAAAATGH